MRRFPIAWVVLVLTALPVSALAQEGPGSPSTAGVVPCTPVIVVEATGLTVDFAATCLVSGPCAWDFGDGRAGEGDVVSHVFAAGGEYIVEVTCGEVAVSRTLIVAAGSRYTGSGLAPFGVAIAVLVLLSAAVLFFSRRARAGT